MTQRFTGKTVLITGGTTGIGFAAATQFIAQGAQVVLTGRNPETLATAQAQLGDQAEAIQSDASSEEDVKALFDQIAERYGKVDAMFLNAGIAKFRDWDNHSLEDFDLMFDVNVKGPWLAIKHGRSVIKDGGSITLTTSIANQLSMTIASAYGASKAAAAQLVKTAAAELAPRGIRVNAVSPGPVETPIWGKTGMPEQQIQDLAAGVVAGIPAGRLGKPEEIANMAVFLASEDAAFIMGQEFVVDGGNTL